MDAADFEVMKDGCILANSGHFNVEINIPALEEMAISTREIRAFTQEYTLADGRRVYLLGYSLGGMVALHAAALDQRVSGVACFSGFTPWRRSSSKWKPWIGKNSWI